MILARTPDSVPLVIRSRHDLETLDDFEIRDAHRGVRIGSKRRAGFEVESVEHLFAALGASGVRRGLEITVEGGEIPLVTGGAAEFADALAELAPPRDPPLLVVARAGRVDLDESTYVFEPFRGTRFDVEVVFDAAAVGTERATWDGSARTFRSDVAWARTFGFRRDAAALLSRGRARGVDARAVMILDDEGLVEPPGAPARAGEFARHKLLDLVGDFYWFGGPPTGVVSALKPGHAATHRAIAVALERKLLEREALPKLGDPGNLDACERASRPSLSG